ncbi:MAG: DUF3035 domain-containing protein [Pseudomonadota bacterium]
MVRYANIVRKLGALGGLCIFLSACGGNSEPELLNLQRGSTPDEFGILPTGPIEEPADYASLPPPNPGGTNRVDPRPEADVAQALGGRGGAAVSPAGDRALLAAAGRFGIDPNIRPELAAADLAFRRDNRGRPLERLFNLNIYFRAYADQALDQHAELDRFRAAGIPTPAPPPDPR